MKREVVVTTGARLHFGLFGFGDRLARRYGGVGAMIDLPLQVRIAALSDDEAGLTEDPARDGTRCRLPQIVPVGEAGAIVERGADFVRRWWEQVQSEPRNKAVSRRPAAADDGHEAGWGVDALRSVRRIEIEILHAPPEHVGLGLGTQLGLAVSYGLFRTLTDERPSLERCATAVGRGLRSAVGTYGFFYGGLIVDQGKRSAEVLSPLQARLELPEAWRWVLIRAPGPVGLSGAAEREAFEQLPSMTDAQADRLRRPIIEGLVPALCRNDFDAFGEQLYRYGKQAGECFAAIQGGSYRNHAIADLVTKLRGWGVAGVGQSSWGPTIFALCPDAAAASALTERLMSESRELEVRTAASRNAPYQIELSESHQSTANEEQFKSRDSVNGMATRLLPSSQEEESSDHEPTSNPETRGTTTESLTSR